MSIRRNCEAGISAMSAVIAAAALSTVIVGCGKAGPALIPVAGKVTIGGKPATEGGVVFHEASKGMYQLIGAIKPDGTYVIMHNREPGAVAGEYRVTVLVTETNKKPDGSPTGLPVTLSNTKFANPTTTPLKVEVKPDAPPGAYDFAVTR